MCRPYTFLLYIQLYIMLCKKHEQLNLVYFVGIDQPLIEYVLDIPEINSVPQSENFSNIFIKPEPR